jgi:hypothetical protein
METLLKLHKMNTKDKPVIMGGLNEKQMESCSFFGMPNDNVF